MAFVRTPGSIDFKFEFTGAGGRLEFPADIDSISTSMTPTWSTYTETGRADPKVAYTEFRKTISLSFKVVAERSSSELLQKFEQLQNLIRGASPLYYGEDTGYQGSFVKFTIGKLYVNQYGFISSLQFAWNNTELTWDIGSPLRGGGTELPMWTLVDMEITWVGRSMPSTTANFFRD